MSVKLSDMLQLGPAQGGGCSNINQTLGRIQQPPLSVSLGQVPPRLLGGAVSHDGHAPEKLCHGEWFSKFTISPKTLFSVGFSNKDKVDSRWAGVKKLLMRARVVSTTTTMGCTTKQKACCPSLSMFPMSVFLQIVASSTGEWFGADELGKTKQNKSLLLAKEVAQQEEGQSGGKGAVKMGT